MKTDGRDGKGGGADIGESAPSRRPSLKTIAQHLNMSVTTVSRALASGERISAETIQRVREAADRLGYVRNLDGVKLRTGRSLVVFALLVSAPEEEVGDTSSIGLLYGIHDRFVGTDYSVRAVPLRAAADAMPTLAEIVQGRLADGVILDHTETDDERVRFLHEAGLPFVTFGRTETGITHAYLDVDNEHVAYSGTSALIRRGFRRVGLIDPDLRFTFARQRLAGYRQALAEHGVAFDERLIRRIDLNAETARRSARELIGEGADGLVCVNEIVLLGALAAARDARAEVGRDLGVACRSGTNIAAYLPVPLVVSFYSRMGAGRTLADLLLRRIAGEPPETLQRIERAELREVAGFGAG
jgi:LacI family transcriptional regulator